MTVSCFHGIVIVFFAASSPESLTGTSRGYSSGSALLVNLDGVFSRSAEFCFPLSFTVYLYSFLLSFSFLSLHISSFVKFPFVRLTYHSLVTKAGFGVDR